MNPELKTEKDYRELARLGKVLGVPVFEAFLTLETFDKNGKRISYHKQRSHSWTRNAYNLIFCQLGGLDVDDSTFVAGKLSGKDTSSAIHYGSYVYFLGYRYNYSVETVGRGYRGSATADDYGILVGTGTNAESFEDYALQTKIATGNAATQLAYGEGEAPAETYTAGTKAFTVDHIRYFNNNSGGTITVNEIALVGNCTLASSSFKDLLMARDKLGSGVALADTGQLKVTYTISLVYAG